MELRQLRTFLAVVECGGFRRAAARLHFSPAAVSEQIAELERSLQTRLFERLPGRVQLTAAGADFLPAARRVIEEFDSAVAAARGPAYGGTLRIGLFPGGAAELTRPLLVELGRLLPGTRLQVVDLPLASWSEAVDGIDALITRDPVDPDRVRATELFAEPLQAAVPWRWPVREAGTLSLDELLALPLIRPAAALPGAFTNFWTLAGHRGEPPELRGYGQDCPEDVALEVAGGFGAALGSPSIRRTFREDRVAFLPVSSDLTTRCWLTTRATDHRPLIEAVHDHTAAIVRRLRSLVLPGQWGRSSLVLE